MLTSSWSPAITPEAMFYYSHLGDFLKSRITSAYKKTIWKILVNSIYTSMCENDWFFLTWLTSGPVRPIGPSATARLFRTIFYFSSSIWKASVRIRLFVFIRFQRARMIVRRNWLAQCGWRDDWRTSQIAIRPRTILILTFAFTYRNSLCFPTRRTFRPDSVWFISLFDFTHIWVHVWGHVRYSIPHGTAVRIARPDIDISTLTTTIIITNLTLKSVFESSPRVFRFLMNSRKFRHSKFQKLSWLFNRHFRFRSDWPPAHDFEQIDQLDHWLHDGFGLIQSWYWMPYSFVLLICFLMDSNMVKTIIKFKYVKLESLFDAFMIC